MAEMHPLEMPDIYKSQQWNNADLRSTYQDGFPTPPFLEAHPKAFLFLTL
jgi:hypothetical protein